MIVPPSTSLPPSSPFTVGFTHLTADFVGASPAQLRDGALLGGLLIAAAGAAGLQALGTPIVRPLGADGLGVLLLLDDGQMTIHAHPARALCMLDLLTLATHDARKALEVVRRRLQAREVRSEQRGRG